ncbi:MAG: hypothetical protein OXC06_18520 [Acidimicrobiaceae bacterium]|nr:hypothetical protein [Acidimicrobiaceae bacterium]
MTAILSQYAATVRDIAILAAAALALLSFGLSLRTSVDSERGRVVVWRLPLLRHVKIEGQEIRRPSARELAQESEDQDSRTLVEGDQNAAASAGQATPGDTVEHDVEEPPTAVSGWVHVPAAMDRSRDPVNLPMIRLDRTRRLGKTRLYLRATVGDQDLLGTFPNIRVNRPGDPAGEVHVPLTDSDAGRLRDAIVGSWVTSLWS